MDQYPMLAFEDFLPSMAQQFGEEAFMLELRNGFHLLMDRLTGLITFESLKTNSSLLGVDGLGDEEVLSMLKEGDLDGDGALNQMEFYILMFRLSPGLMEGSRRWLEESPLKEASEILMHNTS
ncbi:calcium-binding protein KRP1-like [Aristolochia californica]|uniref:calcium-binding protein KRP1-like n=1 Tax=Aristolochia californica TaxID=171875 RepID=UPI0035DEA102